MAITDDAMTLVPNVKLLMQRITIAEAEKTKEDMRRRKNEEAEKKALISRLSQPSGLSDDEIMKKAAAIIERAASNGLTEVQIYRFPNSLCTDGGRAINQQEPGWEKTLTGIALEIYQIWSEHLKPRGYRIRYQIVDFPGDIPGDISVVLVWGD